jgi:hypothetical protein
MEHRMILKLAVAALAFTAFLLALTFWLVRRRRHRLATIAFLCDPDPAIRIVTLQVIQSTGIRPYVDVLGWRTQVEQDPAVLNALSALLSLNTWRTGRSRQLMALGSWAAAYRAQTSAKVFDYQYWGGDVLPGDRLSP